MRKYTRPYVGIKNGLGREVFRAIETPTEELYGYLYLAVIGPFRTARAARIMARYGDNNPHLQCVSDAERISKRYTE